MFLGYAGRPFVAVLAGWGVLAAPAHAAGALVPVHAVLPQAEEVAPDLALSGEIQAQVQSNISFRINGKVTTRQVEVGQHVRADEVLATLDPVEQQADVTNAEAALTSAKALLQQAQLTFERQRSLLNSGYTTRSSFDQAQESLNTTQAQVNAAQAALNTAREQLSYATLRPGHDGVIVSRSVEAGQVVQAGQTVFVLAQDGPRDAVFDVPEVLLTKPPQNKIIDVVLQSDPSISAEGTVREISPILDASTSTVTVKIGLKNSPAGMALGAAVIGRAHLDRAKVYRLPWSALFQAGGQPAVWLVDADNKVHTHPIQVQSYATGSFTVVDGFDDQQRVITAGSQLLSPGQQVQVMPEPKP